MAAWVDESVEPNLGGERQETYATGANGKHRRKCPETRELLSILRRLRVGEFR